MGLLPHALGRSPANPKHFCISLDALAVGRRPTVSCILEQRSITTMPALSDVLKGWFFA